MVGGNVEGQTGVLTTAIVLETRRCKFALALALGGVLRGITLVVNVAPLRLQLRPGEA